MQSSGNLSVADRSGEVDLLLFGPSSLSKDTDRNRQSPAPAGALSNSNNWAVEIPVDELKQLASQHANARHRRGRGTAVTLAASACFCFAIAGSVAWQYYGEGAMGLARTLTSPPALSRPSTEIGLREPANAAASADQPALHAPMVTAELSAKLSRQVETVTAQVAALQQRLEEIAANQQELVTEHSRVANDVVSLQTNEHEIRDLISAQRAIVARLHKQARAAVPILPAPEPSSERTAKAQVPASAPSPRQADSAAPRPPALISEAWELSPKAPGH
jgi:hypothetical protein